MFFAHKKNNFYFLNLLALFSFLWVGCSRSEEKWSHAVKAINQNNLLLFKQSVDQKIAVSKGNYGQNLLYLCGEKGRTEMGLYLLQLGSPVDEKSAAGTTALMSAAAQGKVAFASMLLEHGAKIDLADKGGNTALHVASENGKTDVVQILCHRGANKTLTNADGKTAYQLAKRFNHQAILKILSENP